MPNRKLHIVRNQRYGCILCGRCCRRFHVAIGQADIGRLRGLDWGDDGDAPADFVNRIGGHSYFSRRAGGECVFLDEGTGGCRIHSRFGYRAKALSCRGYPLNIASTYWGEVSVLARMDCPAVARNQGRPLTESRDEIEGLVNALGPPGGFSNEELQGLSRDTIAAICRLLTEVIEQLRERPPHDLSHALFLTVRRLQALAPAFLNDTPTLNEIVPALRKKVSAEAGERGSNSVGIFPRALFREWLAACCRQDEELVSPSLRIRLRRSLTLCSVLFGGGRLRALGSEHPDGSLRHARIFGGGRATSAAHWDCYRRFLLTRLEALQFFGASYYHQPFFDGLRALVLTYPLVLAAARCRAAARKAGDELEEGDVWYAVGAIDHTHGRSPLLQAGMWRIVERFFWDRRFPMLLASME